MKKIVLKVFIFVLYSLVFLGCSLLNPQPDSSAAPTVRREVRDVSAKARKTDDSSPRKRLMILPFLDVSDLRSQGLRDSARAEVIKELNKTGDVIVIDSTDLSLGAKMDFSKNMLGGDYKMDEVSKAARGLGVAALLEGKLLELRVRKKSDEVGVFRQMKTTFDCVARVRIYSSRSGKELFNVTKTVTIEESNIRVVEGVDQDRFFKSNPELLQRLVEDTFLEFKDQILATLDKLSWEGRIAMVQGDRIFLNVGRISGLQMGDILKVSDEGDEVYDPQSGGFIGKSPGRLKGTLELISYFGQDGSIAIVHSGAGFKENDRVELY